MVFTLIRPDEDWALGPDLRLESVPAAGSLVWADEDAHGLDCPDGRPAMYVVDNVMYAEPRQGAEQTVFLFVRLYRGYGEYAPLAATDRMAAMLDAIAGSVEKIGRRLEDVCRMLEGMDDTAGDIKNATDDLLYDVRGLARSAESGFDRSAELLDDIKYRLRGND